jgi:short-subunit dehydrogenase
MISEKTVVLTGASGGIGQSLAQSLASRGAKLILMGRNREQLERIRGNLSGEHLIITADLNVALDRDKVMLFFESLDRPIDILINNAGISCFSLFENMKEQHIQSLLQTNLISPVLFTRGILPHLNADAARVVNVGSTFGSIGYPGFSVYCASKFGLRGFSEALCRELKDSNIRIQHVSPRTTQTSINTTVVTRLNKQLGNSVDNPEAVAEEICNAIEKNKDVLTIGWPEKVFVFTNSVVRKIVDRAIHAQLPIIKKFAQEN